MVLYPIPGAICNLTVDRILAPTDYTNLVVSGCQWIVGSTSSLVAICDFSFGVHYFDIEFNAQGMIAWNSTTFTLSCTDYDVTLPYVSSQYTVNVSPSQLSLQDQGFVPNSLAIANGFVVSQIALNNFGGASDQVNCTFDFDKGLIYSQLVGGGNTCMLGSNSNQIICSTGSVVYSGGMEFDIQYQLASDVTHTPLLIRVSCADLMQLYSATLTTSLDILLPFNNGLSESESESTISSDIGDAPVSSSSKLISWLHL